MGPYAGVDYNLTLCPLQQSRLQHFYHGHSATLCQSRPNPMPESTLSPNQGLWIWPLYMWYFVEIRE
jgi:hypothetical protein